MRRPSPQRTRLVVGQSQCHSHASLVSNVIPGMNIRSCGDRLGILLVLGAAATSGRDRKVACVANFVSGVTIDCVDPQRVARF
jgi:hypothetical protein